MAQRCPKFCFFALKSRWIPIFKLCLFIFRCQQSLLDTILPASVAYLLICTSFAFAHWWLRTPLVANVVMAHWQEKSLCVFVLNNGMLFFFSVLSGIILPVSACHAASPCRELTVCLSGCVNVWLYLNTQYREHVFFLNAYLTYYIPYVGLVWSDVCVFPPSCMYVCLIFMSLKAIWLSRKNQNVREASLFLLELLDHTIENCISKLLLFLGVIFCFSFVTIFLIFVLYGIIFPLLPYLIIWSVSLKTAR